MECPACRSENMADASFCQNCGQKLELICSSCHTANAAASKFCRKCGQRLVAQPAVAAAGEPAWPQGARLTPGAGSAEPYVPPHLAERFRLGHAVHLARHVGERKVISALFADIKGSMSLLDGMDPDAAGQVIDPAVRLMMN